MRLIELWAFQHELTEVEFETGVIVTVRQIITKLKLNLRDKKQRLMTVPFDKQDNLRELHSIIRLFLPFQVFVHKIEYEATNN